MGNYRETSEELKAAWFAYKETNPDTTLSLVDFVAGFNAARIAQLAFACYKATNPRANLNFDNFEAGFNAARSQA